MELQISTIKCAFTCAVAAGWIAMSGRSLSSFRGCLQGSGTETGKGAGSARNSTANGSPVAAAPGEETVQAAEDDAAGQGHLAANRPAKEGLAEAQRQMWDAQRSTGKSVAASHSPALGSGLLADSTPDQAPCQPQQDAPGMHAVCSLLEHGQQAGGVHMWQHSDIGLYREGTASKRKKVSPDLTQSVTMKASHAAAAEHASGSVSAGSRSGLAPARQGSLPRASGLGAFTFKDGLRSLQQGMETMHIPASTQSCPALALRQAASPVTLLAPIALHASIAGPAHGQACAAQGLALCHQGSSGTHQSSSRHAQHAPPCLPAPDRGWQLLHDSQDSVASGGTVWGKQVRQEQPHQGPHTADPGVGGTPHGQPAKNSGQRRNSVQRASSGSLKGGIVQTCAASEAAEHLGSMPAALGGQGSLLQLARLQQLVRLAERSRRPPCQTLSTIAPLHAPCTQPPVPSCHPPLQVGMLLGPMHVTAAASSA